MVENPKTIKDTVDEYFAQIDDDPEILQVRAKIDDIREQIQGVVASVLKDKPDEDARVKALEEQWRELDGIGRKRADAIANAWYAEHHSSEERVFHADEIGKHTKEVHDKPVDQSHDESHPTTPHGEHGHEAHESTEGGPAPFHDESLHHIETEISAIDRQIGGILTSSLNETPEFNTKLKDLRTQRKELEVKKVRRLAELAAEWKKRKKEQSSWMRTKEFFKDHATESKWAAGAASLALLTPPVVVSSWIWLPFGAAGWAYGAYRKAYPKEAAPAHEHSEASHGSPH